LSEYYSFHLSNKRKGFIRTLFIRLLVKGCILGIIHGNIRYIRQYEWLPVLKNIKKQARILDIGCGNGFLLKEMYLWGFKNLTGIDPFIEKEIEAANGIKIYKQSVFEHNGKYDFIIMNHSFEHMDKPYEILLKCNELLTINGLLLICVPVSDSYAFRKYGANWGQLDAPRHLFLYTTNSLSILAKSTGFTLENIIYDSKSGQFIGSEKYQNAGQKVAVPYRRKKELQKFAKRLNVLRDGDQACFTFRKNCNNGYANIDKQ